MFRSAASTLALAIASLSSPLLAQTPPAEPIAATPAQTAPAELPPGPIQTGETTPDVVVTGTFIRGTARNAALPVDVITGAEILRQGSPSLVELIKSLPASAGVLGDSNQFGAPQNSGTGNINLRGLGAQRTLVLLNGRRLTNSPGGTFVDTNLLPTMAVGRIEVLKDGAAALYGSDAIGGVVNFITREDLNGLEANANFSFVDGSDGEYNLGLNWGRRGERGSVLLSAAYRHRSELSTRKRAFAIRPFADNPQGGWSQFGNPATYTPLLASGSPAGVFVDPACDTIGGPRGAGTTPNCLFQYTQFDNLVEDEDHYQLFGSGRLDVTDRLELRLEGLFAGHDVPRENSSPSYSPVQFPTAALNGRTLAGVGFYVPSSNPGLQALLATYPAAQLGGTLAASQARANGVATTLLFRPFGVSGNPLTGFQGKEDRREFEAYRISGGATFRVTDAITADAAVTYMDNRSDISTPDILVSRLALALRGLGGTACNVAANTPGQNGCLYFNPFSSGIAANATDGRTNPLFVPSTQNSREVVDYLFEDYAFRTRARLLVGDLVISGKTGISLPGGEIGFALGGQFRRNSADRQVAPLADVAVTPCVDTPVNGNLTCAQRNGGFSFFGPLNSYDLDRDVKAVFAEVQAPLTDWASLQGAVRHESYGGRIGSTTNPKLALRVKLTDWLALRGSASTTFRAPPVTQLDVAPTTTLQFVSAVGGYRAFDGFGNPNLQPETANSYNAGAIVELGGFNLTVDYYRFDFKDGIQSEPGGALISALFPTGSTDAAACAAAAGNAAFFSRFTFSNNVCSRANLLRTRTTTVNGPGLKTSGIDLSASYRHDIGLGRIAVGFDGSYVLDFRTRDFAVDGIVVAPGRDFAGTLDIGANGSIPEFKSQTYVQYDNGAHSLRYTFRYVGGMEDLRGSTVFTAATPFGKNIGAFATIDLNYTLTVKDTGSTLTVSAVNVTGEAPPFARLDLNYDPFTANPLGRVIKVGLRQKF